jgi:hypothetical protein
MEFFLIFIFRDFLLFFFQGISGTWVQLVCTLKDFFTGATVFYPFFFQGIS